MAKKLKIYTGSSVSWKTLEGHPVNKVKEAKQIVDQLELNGIPLSIHSNNIDFISFATEYAQKKGHEVELFINDKSVGKDLQLVFDDFNKVYDLMDKYLEEDGKEI